MGVVLPPGRGGATRRGHFYTGKISQATYNGVHDLWEKSGLEPLPFPVQVLLSSALVDMFNAAGRQEYIGPFAGQVCGLIDDIKPAAEIVDEMVEQATDILGRKLAEEVQLA